MYHMHLGKNVYAAPLNGMFFVYLLIPRSIVLFKAEVLFSDLSIDVSVVLRFLLLLCCCQF